MSDCVPEYEYGETAHVHLDPVPQDADRRHPSCPSCSNKVKGFYGRKQGQTVHKTAADREIDADRQKDNKKQATYYRR